MRISNILKSIIGISLVVFLFSSCFHPDNKINATCFDEVLNQDEIFVDCGGPNCDECPPACDNGILDYEEGWEEWGIDCGGPCESCCENGIWDTGHPFDETLDEQWVDCGGIDILCGPCLDCNDGVHTPGEETTIGGVLLDAIDCDDDPTTEDCPPCASLCDDGLLNGVEGPCVDCGGACEPCNFDHCENGVLDDNIDLLPDDLTQNETEVDCGGCGCPSCDLLCIDGILNGAEEAIDCGGGVCVECDDISLCSDGVQNGYETGVDCYDGTASDESACLPCLALCMDMVFNGYELDTDCGGPDCPTCGIEELSFMTYTVTTETESSILYETNNVSYLPVTADAAYFSGDIADPIDIETVTFSGGIAHSLLFTLIDDDLVDQNWGAEDFDLDNNVVISGSPNNVMFTAHDGIVYESKNHPDGILLSNFSLDYTPAIPGPTPTPAQLELSGTFSGTMADNLGQICTISNGEFLIFIGLP